MLRRVNCQINALFLYNPAAVGHGLILLGSGLEGCGGTVVWMPGGAEPRQGAEKGGQYQDEMRAVESGNGDNSS